MNIQAIQKEFWGNSCYIWCLTRLFTELEDMKAMMECILQGWKANDFDNDGYVRFPLEYIERITGLKYKDVKKVAISKISDIPSEPTIVEMLQPNGKDSHFVCCHFDGTNVILDFDPSGISNSWKGQKFISYRKFIK